MYSSLALEELSALFIETLPEVELFLIDWQLPPSHTWYQIKQGSGPYTSWHLGVILEITPVSINFSHSFVDNGLVNILNLVLAAFLLLSVQQFIPSKGYLCLSHVFPRSFQDQLLVEGLARRIPVTPRMRGDWCDSWWLTRGWHRRLGHSTAGLARETWYNVGFLASSWVNSS